ncbi:hypothetical protein DSM104443_02288 [Usitatibacter rugosus]|uniref:Sel1 repeat-containing protein n=1 Tax=Usitatibacter rugosus TaxID=2732067 RepID=A0A6M4GW30_9PROT|nr:tetratricopeptide repeat protein [Usitatibacter rugosus]QJR11215.1 hypothetical protein DSM104443_02288 [Usitatibacter rugosus]
MIKTSLVVALLALSPNLDAANPKAAEAQRLLGMKYYQGEGVKQDIPKAVMHLENAAKAGDTEAAITLGKMYEYGMSVPVDLARAATWYVRGAELGAPQAQFESSVAYYKGQGVGRDLPEAVKWWTIASACPGYAEKIRPSVASAESKLDPTVIEEGQQRAKSWAATHPAPRCTEG